MRAIELGASQSCVGLPHQLILNWVQGQVLEYKGNQDDIDHITDCVPVGLKIWEGAGVAIYTVRLLFTNNV